MSSEYAPDLWTVLQLTDPASERHWRILASWYGGFAEPDSWGMSSGITKMEDGSDLWRVHNVNGSVYLCVKGAQGTSGFASGVLAYYQEAMRAAGAALKELPGLADVMVPVNAALVQRPRNRVEGVQVDLGARLPPGGE